MADERLRRRVAEIASVDDGALSDAARERILRSVMMQGPALVHSARWKRRAMYAAGPALAVAAGFAIYAARVAEPKAPEMAVVERPAPAVAVKAPACAARPAPATKDFVASGANVSTLDLGEVALAVADPGAVIHAESLESCKTILGLDSGRVTVHAKNLGGGELSVHTASATVTVRGTVFAVTKSDASLVVEVAEGTVSVKGDGEEHWVHAGERLNVSPVGAAQGALDHERERELRGVVGAPAIVGLEALPTEAEANAENAALAPQVQAQPPRPSRSRGAVEGAATTASKVALADETESAGKASEGEKVADLPEVTEPPRVTLPETAPEAKKAEGAAEWLTQAEQARKAGKFAEARVLYRQVAEKGGGATAEAAWVALARMELSLGHPAAARDATKRRQERFGHGTLEPEALWIDVRTYRQTGDAARARDLAEELVRRWPASPQARAAQQWLSGEN